MRGAALALFLLLLGLIVACDSASGRKKTFIKIGTGPQVGVYYTAGLALADLINDGTLLHGIDASVESTQGSVFNINALQSGNVDFAFAQADRQFQAVKGEGVWEGRPVGSLRFVCGLYSETLNLVVNASREIEGVEGLRGKIVSLGAPGSGTRGTAKDCLELFDLESGRDFQEENFGAGEAAMMLQDGRIDGYFYATAHPNGSLTEVTNGKRKVSFVPIKRIRQLLKKAPYYHKAEVPLGFYPRAENGSKVETIGMRTALLTTEEVSEEVVYEAVKRLFEHLEWFRKRHPSFQDLKHREMALGGFAPLHPGARRYFIEEGLLD